MTRVLLVVRPAAGGMAAHVRAICLGLDRQRYQVAVACPPDHALPGNVERLPLPIADRIAPLSDARALAALYRYCRAGAFDLVHAHGLKAALLAALIHRRPGTPRLVVTLHNALPRQGTGYGCRPSDLFLRWCLQPASRVVVVSRRQQQELLARGLTSAERIAHIPNGVRLAAIDDPALPSRAATRARLRLKPQECAVLMVSRLWLPKGVGDFLAACRALRSHPRLRFFIAGAGPDESACRQIAAEWALTDRVAFLGQRGDVPALLRAADIFALPSWDEGLPLTVLEAMAARLPVVATSVGGIPELVIHGETGLLVPPRRPGELAAALLRLAADPAERKRLGEAGRHRVEAAFTESAMLSRLQQLYSGLLP